MELKLFSLSLLLFLTINAFTTTSQECLEEPIDFGDCPPEDPNGHPAYFPYPYDCTKFIICTNGEPKVECCAEGTRWDQSLTTCNHESLIDCIIVTTEVPGFSSTFTTTTTTTTTPTTTTPTTTTPTTTTPTSTTPTTTTPTTTTPTSTTPTTTTPTTTTPTSTTPTTTTPTTTTPTSTTPTTTTPTTTTPTSTTPTTTTPTTTTPTSTTPTTTTPTTTTPTSTTPTTTTPTTTTPTTSTPRPTTTTPTTTRPTTPRPTTPTTTTPTTTRPTTPTIQRCVKQQNADIGPPDLAVRIGHPESACCGICQNTPGCLAYAWRGSDGMPANTCYLKNRTGPIIYHPTVSIGIITNGNEDTNI